MRLSELRELGRARGGVGLQRSSAIGGRDGLRPTFWSSALGRGGRCGVNLHRWAEITGLIDGGVKLQTARQLEHGESTAATAACEIGLRSAGQLGSRWARWWRLGDEHDSWI